uniref:Uncharacterized protein n=1 Tax=Romanomermis culicivorax TaxID=13658 RepID=A0A915JI21_ROMCU
MFLMEIGEIGVVETHLKFTNYKSIYIFYRKSEPFTFYVIVQKVQYLIFVPQVQPNQRLKQKPAVVGSNVAQWKITIYLGRYFLLHPADKPDLVVQPASPMQSNVALILGPKGTNPYTANQLFYVDGPFIRTAQEPNYVLGVVGRPTDRQTDVILLDYSSEPKDYWSYPSVDKKPYIKDFSTYLSLLLAPFGYTMFPEVQTITVHIYCLSGPQNSVLTYNQPDNGKVVLKPKATGQPQTWRFLLYNRLILIQLVNDMDTVLQPTPGLQIDAQLKLTPRAKNPCSSDQFFFVDNGFIRTVNNPQLVLTSVQDTGGQYSLKLKQYREGAKEQQWKVVPTTSKTEKFMDVFVFVGGHQPVEPRNVEPGREIQYLPVHINPPFYDMMVVEVEVNLTPGSPLKITHRKPNHPGQKFIFVYLTKKFFVIQLWRSNPPLVVQPKMGNMDAKTTLVLQPMAPNPAQEQQVFFAEGKTIRCMNKPERVISVPREKPTGTDQVEVFIDLAVPNSPAQEWLLNIAKTLKALPPIFSYS